MFHQTLHLEERQEDIPKDIRSTAPSRNGTFVLERERTALKILEAQSIELPASAYVVIKHHLRLPLSMEVEVIAKE